MFQCVHDITMAYGLVLSLFLAGLVGGFTHCAGMCSPFVLAQVTTGENGAPVWERLSDIMLVPYHLGRMSTYVILAVIVHSFVNLAFLFSGVKVIIASILLMLAGVLFFASAFPALIQFFPWIARLSIVVPLPLFQKISKVLMEKSSFMARYGLGLLLGFMPCGLVLSALMASATADSAIQAAGAMGAFALGTVPALVLVALGGGALKAKYPKFGANISRLAMVVSGLWLFALAGFMVF